GTGQDRADDGPDREPAKERGGRAVVISLAHVLRTEGPRMATADEIPIPIHATTDAASRLKSPMVSRLIPSRPPRASPAQAPRIEARTMMGNRPPALPRIST